MIPSRVGLVLCSGAVENGLFKKKSGIGVGG